VIEKAPSEEIDAFSSRKTSTYSCDPYDLGAATEGEHDTIAEPALSRSAQISRAPQHGMPRPQGDLSLCYAGAKSSPDASEAVKDRILFREARSSSIATSEASSRLSWISPGGRSPPMTVPPTRQRSSGYFTSCQAREPQAAQAGMPAAPHVQSHLDAPSQGNSGNDPHRVDSVAGRGASRNAAMAAARRRGAQDAGRQPGQETDDEGPVLPVGANNSEDQVRQSTSLSNDGDFPSDVMVI